MNNSVIEEALRAYSETEGEEEKLNFIDILVEQMKDEFEVLTAIIERDDSDEEGAFSLQTVDGEDGPLAVAFTSTEEYQKGDEATIMPIVFTDLIDLVMQEEECHGLVFNPWGDYFALGKDGLVTLIRASMPPTQDELDLASGVEAYRNGDFERAVEFYQKSAAAGNVTAMSNLGYCYYYGRSIDVDKQKACELWTRAAIFNDICATYKLGDMNRNGDLPEDMDYAKMLYRKAFVMSLDDMDIYSFPDAFLRIVKYCSDDFEPEQLANIADDCIRGLEMRIEDGDNFSGKLLSEARELRSML